MPLVVSEIQMVPIANRPDPRLAAANIDVETGWAGAGSRMRRWIAVAVLVGIGLSVRISSIDAPLLEGAAGKQAHTAMVARNMLRGRATMMYPVVDDVGHPGYFIKEFPAVPAVVAFVYRAVGTIDERVGRAVGVVCYLAALPVLLHLIGWRNPLCTIGAGLWFVISPLGIAYSRSFMNDPAAVLMSLVTLAAVVMTAKSLRWQWAVTAGASLGASVLLKPHTMFWLGPSIGVVLFDLYRRRARSSSSFALLTTCLLLGLTVASPWYVHAARIHMAYPVHGAMVSGGWFEPSLMFDWRVYREIGRQLFEMVFTPPGVLVSLVGVPRLLCRRSVGTLALLAWAAGVVVQCALLNTRMLDVNARGSEYYQLAMVPASAVLISNGATVLGGALRNVAGIGAAYAGYVAITAALFIASISPTRAALAAPAEYSGVLAQCDVIKRLTSTEDELVILADRSGVVAYYCDRRGTTFTVGSAREVGAVREVARNTRLMAFARAQFVYVPFPRLIEDSAGLRRLLDREWTRVSHDELTGHLYRR